MEYQFSVRVKHSVVINAGSESEAVEILKNVFEEEHHIDLADNEFKLIDTDDDSVNFDFNDPIYQWHIERKTHLAQPEKQMLKLSEEVGELAAAIARNKKEDIADALGDIEVVLYGLCLIYGIDKENNLLNVYNNIKDRKGKLINGIFVKEGE